MKQRYNAINDFFKERFGSRVYKVSLDAQCSCPNRDGTIGNEGCAFCNERSYHPATNVDGKLAERSIAEQLADGIQYVRNRHGATRFVAYFQRGSNTYGPLNKLATIYNDAIDHPDVVGLAISTRPDCISPAMLDLLYNLASKIFLWVELGLQTANDASLRSINRGHTVDDFARAHEALKQRGIPVCAHVIVGLPGEGRQDIIETASFLNRLGLWGVKIHNLHILEGTTLAAHYNDRTIEPLTLTSYASLVADFLEHLSPDTLIHRLNSHSPRSVTVAPDWSVNKLATFNAVEAELEKRNTRQGRSINPVR